MNEPADIPEMAFESALTRLEQILEKMNTGAVPLDEALKLYEEADRLIAVCNKRLNEAERKIEMLTKNRSGETLGPDGKPLTEPFPFNGK
jgi:exodeoxyribonuclease VII small subunit